MPKLVVIKGPLKNTVFELDSREIFFCGRSPRMNDVTILEIAVSRKHFKIFKIGRDFFIEDLNSKHGTLVNGKAIEPGEGFQINEDDLIEVGNTVMQFIDADERGAMQKPVRTPENGENDAPLEDALKKERRSAKELEMVYNVSELLRTHIDLEIFLKEFLKLVLKEFPRIDNASVFLFRDKDYTWKKTIEIVTDPHEKSVSRYKKEILNKVVMEQKTIRMSNTEFELPQSYIEKGETLEIKSAMCVPIISNNELLGAIYIESIKPYGFRKKDQFLLNSLVGSLAVAIEKNRLVEKTSPYKSFPFKEKFFSMIRKI